MDRQRKAPGQSFSESIERMIHDEVEKLFVKVPGWGFDSVLGKEELKQRLLEEAANEDAVPRYLFYGPPGAGKNHLLKAFANELHKEGFQFIYLRGSDVCNAFVGIAEKTIPVAFAAAQAHEPCLLLVDEVEELCADREHDRTCPHEKRITVAFLEAYRQLVESGKRVVFVASTNLPGRVDAELLKNITLIKIPYPTKEERMLYFDSIMPKVPCTECKYTLEDGFTLEEMAEAMEDFPYGRMRYLRDDLNYKLNLQIKQEYGVRTQQGKMDYEATAQRINAAHLSGKIKLTRALFEQVLEKFLRTDLSLYEQKMKEFEERVSAING